ncbi:hypothetical protein CWI37_1468p0010 [Hamiltosporidium tvaerminnensis]|uniref:Uncharacterized protein n=1 Tax=Hamiltosporidium tvaerminnensis TaxID=1176355 RepID=A0A4Q9KVZ0_9MICR|nr:hypothetical protein CWI37_1468p0010 [Hamiltosporidium tvaerminnensis]
MHKQPTPPLKEVKNEEDSVKQVNSKNILPLILDDVTRPEEPTIDINDKSDVEKENKVVRVMEEIKIFLCDHIKKSEFLIFYEFLISYYLLNNKMTIDKFYTILYFLEYFRVKQDDKLRNLMKMILYSLSISDDIKHFDLDKVSFHFSKQVYFSHEMFKKISQEYFKIMNFKMSSFLPFFIKENEYDISNRYKGLYSKDKKHVLEINFEFTLFFNEYKSKNRKSKKLFILLLNTLDIKYLNDNLICTNQTKIVFITSKFVTNIIFKDNLSKINEIIFYEDNILNKNYKVMKILDIENLNTIDRIIKNLQHSYRKSFKQNSIFDDKNMAEIKRQFYFKVFKQDELKNKVKIIESLYFNSTHREIKGLKELERLTISNSEIVIENNVVFSNKSIKYYRFQTHNCDSFSLFYQLISTMTSLKEIFVEFSNRFEFNSFMKPNIDFRELNLINRDYSKYIFEILGRLFFEMFVEKYDLSRIKKIYLCNISIDKLDFEALGNLLYLEELEMYRTKFKNIYFSELFCTSREYKIKRLKFTKINIKESDFNFISNLKILKTLQFYKCKIQTPTHSGTNMKLKKEFEL